MTKKKKKKFDYKEYIQNKIQNFSKDYFLFDKKCQSLANESYYTQQNIKNNGFYWRPLVEVCNDSIYYNTWVQQFCTTYTINYEKPDTDGYTTKRIKLYLTKSQKEVIDKWFDMYIDMYNVTIKLMKTYLFNKQKIPSINQMKVLLASEKENIKIKSKINVCVDGKNKDVFVDKHLLDYAINDALRVYKQGSTNKNKKNIKSFRLRYLKHTKPNKIIKMEKLATRDKTFYPSALGKYVSCRMDNFSYVNNMHTIAIITKRKNDYYLLLKYPTKKSPKIVGNEIISIDPGISPYITGYANNSIIKIGTSIGKQIKRNLMLIDKRYKRQDVSNPKKRKYKKKKMKKIRNIVNDYQWKIASYLTKNYTGIIFGNWSTKNTGEKNGDKMSKRIANCLSIYKLKEKIRYMAYKRRCKFKEQNENYTSKCCGRCGYIKYDLGANKTYTCNNCNLKIDRDINGARNILLMAI